MATFHFRENRLLPLMVLLSLLCGYPRALTAQQPRPVDEDSSALLHVTSPLDYEVFQRQTKLEGVVLMQGRAAAGADRVEALVADGTLGGKRWRPVALDRSTHEFRDAMKAHSGGFYSVRVRAFTGSRVIAQAEIAHVGVGEVFVIAGQSNSTNYGEVRQTPETGKVSTFSGTEWRLADDPQPGVQDGSSKGSFIPAFGDAMYRRYGVPIGVASVGHGSTSVRQWLPKGENAEVMPTMGKYIVKGEDGALTSDGTLFEGMMKRIDELGPHGFRAVLWHQGESDADQPLEHTISAETYRRMTVKVIDSARKRSGWEIPWFVAQVSYHTPADQGNPAIRAAQKSLWESGVALEGPDSDTLTIAYREKNGQGTHMNAAGLKAHGELWAQAVERYLDRVLR